MYPTTSHALEQQLQALQAEGRDKGAEQIIRAVLPPQEGKGQRYLLVDSDSAFIKMNSNDYLGLATHPHLVAAAEAAAQLYGVGPGAVRFISGTQQVHRQLEQSLSTFHQRDDTIIYNSAYAAVLSSIHSLTSKQTAILSDELNHNCIINGMRVARPAHKAIYKHLDLQDLRDKLAAIPEGIQRVIVITDGIFSMRGSYAPLAEIRAIVDEYAPTFAEGVILMVDDSHGVGAFGATGRGTEEFCGARADVLVGTLGKAFGVNGGYVTGSQSLVSFLREMSPMYIYSNPIGPAEAGALLASLQLVQASAGAERLANLQARTQQFEQGLAALGHEYLASPHPVTPLMLRDTSKARAMVQHLFAQGVLATGIVYPVVPKGDESIRFQINANLTELDVQEVLEAIAAF